MSEEILLKLRFSTQYFRYLMCSVTIGFSSNCRLGPLVNVLYWLVIDRAPIFPGRHVPTSIIGKKPASMEHQSLHISVLSKSPISKPYIQMADLDCLEGLQSAKSGRSLSKISGAVQRPNDNTRPSRMLSFSEVRSLHAPLHGHGHVTRVAEDVCARRVTDALVVMLVEHVV